MACCIVAAVLVGVLRWVIPGRRARIDVAQFAPVAMRAAPGATMRVPATASPEVASPRRAASARVLRAGAAGVIGYLTATAMLAWLGLIHSAAPTPMWLLRSAVLTIVAGAALIIASRAMRDRLDPLTARQTVGAAAVGIGVVVLEGTAIDMHVVHLYHVHAAYHQAVHITTVAMLLVGLTLLLWVGTARRVRTS